MGTTYTLTVTGKHVIVAKSPEMTVLKMNVHVHFPLILIVILSLQHTVAELLISANDTAMANPSLILLTADRNAVALPAISFTHDT